MSIGFRLVLLGFSTKFLLLATRRRQLAAKRLGVGLQLVPLAPQFRRASIGFRLVPLGFSTKFLLLTARRRQLAAERLGVDPQLVSLALQFRRASIGFRPALLCLGAKLLMEKMRRCELALEVLGVVLQFVCAGPFKLELTDRAISVGLQFTKCVLAVREIHPASDKLGACRQLSFRRRRIPTLEHQCVRGDEGRVELHVGRKASGSKQPEPIRRRLHVNVRRFSEIRR